MRAHGRAIVRAAGRLAGSLQHADRSSLRLPPHAIMCTRSNKGQHTAHLPPRRQRDVVAYTRITLANKLVGILQPGGYMGSEFGAGCRRGCCHVRNRCHEAAPSLNSCFTKLRSHW